MKNRLSKWQPQNLISQSMNREKITSLFFCRIQMEVDRIPIKLMRDEKCGWNHRGCCCRRHEWAKKQRIEPSSNEKHTEKGKMIVKTITYISRPQHPLQQPQQQLWRMKFLPKSSFTSTNFNLFSCLALFSPSSLSLYHSYLLLESCLKSTNMYTSCAITTAMMIAIWLWFALKVLARYKLLVCIAI